MKRSAAAALAALMVLSLAAVSLGRSGEAVATDCSAGWVALTYDDGPIPGRTDAVLSALDRAGVQATFFTVGYLVRSYPDIVRRTADRGHVVANHTYRHEILTRESDSSIVSTIDRTDAAIRDTGVDAARLVRPPGGNTNSRVKSAIERAGYRQVMWSWGPLDYNPISASTIANGVISHAKDGAVFVLHDGSGNYRNLAAATDRIVSTLHSRGFCFGVLNNQGDIVPADEAAEKVGPFYDVAESVFTDDILWMYDAGVTKGCNPPYNNRYCPDRRVTRGEMAAFLGRALNLADGAGSNAFTDDDDSPFEADIERLAAAGITKGCNPPDNTRFCPDRRVTRAEMAAFLGRALSLADGAGSNAFTDDDDSIFQADIERLAAAGITKGCNPPDNTRFCPVGSVTRGQMAAFLHRAADLLP
ncbi:MAG: polysaccharide deacetylase family protein [Actinomycetota bacterium]|nr:polysaccharide deacetylase family protein [Actinomycetota bacterium]